jgi:hypothetical protein
MTARAGSAGTAGANYRVERLPVPRDPIRPADQQQRNEEKR